MLVLSTGPLPMVQMHVKNFASTLDGITIPDDEESRYMLFQSGFLILDPQTHSFHGKWYRMKKRQFLLTINKNTIYLRPFFCFFVVFDTPAGLEAFLRCRVRVAGAEDGDALRGLYNGGGGLRAMAASATWDLVFMRLPGAGAIRTFLARRGGLGRGGESGVGSRAAGEGALLGTLDL